MSKYPHVVIVGAGFGGLGVAEQLRQIARRMFDEQTQPFKYWDYWDKGFMATIGRGLAVVEFPNQLTLHGPPAYFAWLGVHLALLNGARNRIETLWNWGWSALTHDRAARIIIEGDEGAPSIASTSVPSPVAEEHGSYGEQGIVPDCQAGCGRELAVDLMR